MEVVVGSTLYLLFHFDSLQALFPHDGGDPRAPNVAADERVEGQRQDEAADDAQRGPEQRVHDVGRRVFAVNDDVPPGARIVQTLVLLAVHAVRLLELVHGPLVQPVERGTRKVRALEREETEIPVLSNSNFSKPFQFQARKTRHT